MTKESFQSIPLEELEALARDEGYELNGATNRAALTEFILENLKERKREEEEENSPSIRVEESKYRITEPQSADLSSPDTFPIEKRYNQSKIVFIIRDPHWAFAYWDLDNKCREKLPSNDEVHQLVLRVYDIESVDFAGSGANSSFDIPIQNTDSSWYIYLPNQDCSYILELGVAAEGRYKYLARSNAIRTPREGFSEHLPEIDSGPALNLLSEFSVHGAVGSSGTIPQRILTVGRE